MPTFANPRLAAAALLMAGGCAIMDPELLDRSATDVVNGGFEVDTQGWQANGGGQLSRSTARAHSGNASLLTQQRTQPWMGPMATLTGLVVRGRSYTATAYVQLAAPGSAITRLTVRHTCAETGPGFNVDATVETATADPISWVQPSITFRVNDAPTCTLVEVVLYAEMATSTAAFFLDDVVVHEVP